MTSQINHIHPIAACDKPYCLPNDDYVLVLSRDNLAQLVSVGTQAIADLDTDAESSCHA